MATASKSSPPTDPPAPEDGGFSEKELGQIEALIQKVVGSSTPPAGDPAQPARTKPTDEQWDAMSDRQRETWVRQECDWWLTDLVKMDEDRKLREKVDALAKPPEPEPEKPPSIVSRFQKFMWGEPDKQAS